MNWLQKIAKNSLRKEISLRGWSEEQQKKDALDVWKDNNKVFFSIGDWAKIETDDIIGAIKYIYPDVQVEWDFEAGPGNGNWEKIV